jgi:hypothetical protein
MKYFAARRWCNFAVLALVSAVLLAASAVLTVSLHSTAKLTGWALLALVVGLASYNVRKKLPFLPLGSSALWLQLHIYAGLLSIVMFGLHLRWRVPTGAFETVLALVFAAVAGSGVAGLWISRTLAARVTTRGDEVIYERIPALRQRLQIEVEQLLLKCLAETESTAIPDFYLSRLKPFFDGPRNFWRHLGQSLRPCRQLLLEIEAQDRYLNDTERQYLQKIADRVRAKDALDYHYALQSTLKYWLFVHVPLTYGLLVLAAFHAVLVQAFSGVS